MPTSSLSMNWLWVIILQLSLTQLNLSPTTRIPRLVNARTCHDLLTSTSPTSSSRHLWAWCSSQLVKLPKRPLLSKWQLPLPKPPMELFPRPHSTSYIWTNKRKIYMKLCSNSLLLKVDNRAMGTAKLQARKLLSAIKHLLSSNTEDRTTTLRSWRSSRTLIRTMNGTLKQEKVPQTKSACSITPSRAIYHQTLLLLRIRMLLEGLLMI